MKNSQLSKISIFTTLLSLLICNSALAGGHELFDVTTGLKIKSRNHEELPVQESGKDLNEIEILKSSEALVDAASGKLTDIPSSDTYLQSEAIENIIEQSSSLAE